MSITIYAEADTYLQENTPTTNYGLGTNLNVGNIQGAPNADEGAHTLIRFDTDSLTPNKFIQCVLRLNISGISLIDAEVIENYIDVYALLVAFDETTATWNKRNATTNWNQPGASSAGVDYDANLLGSIPFPSLPLDPYYEIDLGTIRQERIANGLLIKPRYPLTYADESTHRQLIFFDSIDYTVGTGTNNSDPQLIVTYGSDYSLIAVINSTKRFRQVEGGWIMGNVLRQSTAVTLQIGPFLDTTDGFSLEAGLTISQGDVKLSKAGGVQAQKNEASAASYDANGFYQVALDATDTNTVGQLDVSVVETGALPVCHSYTVVPQQVYDSIIAGTDALDTSAIQLVGDADAAAALKNFWKLGVTANSVHNPSATATDTTFETHLTFTEDNIFAGASIVFITGANAGLWRRIVSSTYTDHALVVSPALLEVPADNDTFQIAGRT
ncbi:DNRLRE domain-containing protein [Candidatus Pacearchaeota archaeon]|jgi:hypothetical protein|nr:DNRLRE domain-containing protein [Candidatus Pacearchaeota archaeon]